MKKNKIFIACDTNNISKVKEIIKKTQSPKLKIGYKFGLEFLNSKNGRNFLSSLKNKITFADLKLHDIPNTCISTIKAIKDLKVNYLTIHISSGPEALKACKKVSGKTKLIGVTILTSLDNKALKEIGFDKDVKKIVLNQARLIQFIYFFSPFFKLTLAFLVFFTNCFLLAVFFLAVAFRSAFESDCAFFLGKQRCVFLPFLFEPQEPAMFPCVSMRTQSSSLNHFLKFSSTIFLF